MKKLISRIFTSFLGGLIIDVGACVFTIVYLLFTTPDGSTVSKTGLFGAVFFELSSLDDGDASIVFGLNSTLSFLLIWLVAALFIFVCMYLFSMLYTYRQELIARQSQENSDAGNIDASSDGTIEKSLNDHGASSTNALARDTDRDRGE